MNSHHFANVGLMIAEKGKIKPCSLSLLDEQISKNILENMINFLKFEGQKIRIFENFGSSSRKISFKQPWQSYF